MTEPSRPESPRVQASLAGLLGLVAAAALNAWLFRLSLLGGIVGLAVLKHLAIAWLCRSLGVDRRGSAGRNPLPGGGLGPRSPAAERSGMGAGGPAR